MAHRKINTRFCIYLFGIVTGLSICAHFVHGYHVHRNATAMLDRADRCQERGNLALAADYLRRYVAFNPTDADGLARYGLLLSEPKLAKSNRQMYLALQILEKALYRDADLHDLRRRVVRIAIDLGLYARALDDLKILITQFPSDGELQELRGRCQERTAQYKAARASYEASMKLAPNKIETYAKLAKLLRRHPDEVFLDKETGAGMKQQADQVMDLMVKTNERSYKAYLLRAHDRRTEAPGDKQAEEQADADVARARELEPDALDVLMLAAELELRKGGDDHARLLLKRALNRYPEEARPYQALARLETTKGHSEQAIAVLNSGLSKLRNQVDLTWELADVLVSAGQTDLATAAISSLEKIGIPEPELACFRARLLMNTRNWREAGEKLEKAAASLSARSSAGDETLTAMLAQHANLLLGRCCDALGDFDRSAAAYGRVVVRDSRSIPGRVGLATALCFLGRNAEALDQYRQLTRLPAYPAEVLSEIARVLLLRNLEREDARRNWDEVDKAIIDAERALQPLPVQVVVLRVEMLAAQGDYLAAQAHLLKKYGDPTSRPPQAWIALAALKERQRLYPEAMALLDEAEKHIVGSVDLRLARARHLARHDHDTSEPAMAKLAEGLDQFNLDDRRRLLSGLAAVAMQSGRSPLADRLWRQLAKEQPDDLRCHVGLFDLAAQANNVLGMQQCIDNLKRIEGVDGALWRYARASLLTGQAARGNDKSGLKEARSLVASVAVLRSYWARVALCQGQIDDLDNRQEAALESYLQALRAGERDPLAFRRAVELLYERHRYDEAYELMRRLPDSVLLPEELRRIGAELALYSRDGRSALRLAKASVDAGSTDYRDHLWLGRVYMALQDTKNAGSALARARELAPAEPDPWVANIQFLIVTGDKERAQTEVEAGVRTLTGTKGRLALAFGYEVVGKVDQARKQYEEALAASPGDVLTVRSAASFYLRYGQFAKTKPLLQRLTKELKSHSADSANWARRNLAIVLSVEGDPARTSEALALLLPEEGSTTRTDVDGLKRTRAVVLAMQNDRAMRAQAVELLDGLIAGRSATPEDYFLSAQLHEALGDWPKARQRFLTLVEMPGGDTQAHLIVCTRSMLRNKEVEEARRLVGMLEKLDANGLSTIEFKARLLNADGKSTDAIALLQSFGRSDNNNILNAAAVLADLGENSAAEELFRLAVERIGKPRESLILAQFLISRKRGAEALQICERIWAEAPPVAVAEVALIAISEGTPDPQQLDRFDKKLVESLKLKPDVVELIVALATVRNFQGRYDDAESLYRSAIAKNPRQGPALNNLAWLLALRGRGSEALGYIRQATEAVGTDPGLLDTRGVAYLALKQTNATEQAIKDLETAVTQSPTAALFFHLAQAYSAAGRRADAAVAWRRAKSLGLTPQVLHPLERPAHDQMLRELN